MNFRFCLTFCLLSLTGVFGSGVTQAHFPWLVVEGRESAQPQLHCYFSEVAVSDDPAMLSHLGEANAGVFTGKDKTLQAFPLKKSADGWQAPLNSGQTNQIFTLQHNLGVRERGGESYFVKYYAFAGPPLSAWDWISAAYKKAYDVSVLPAVTGDELELTVTLKGMPIAEAEIQLYSHAAPLGESLRTNESGQVRVDLVSQTIDAFRVKVVEKTSGTENGQSYQEVRHYLTVTFPSMSYHQLHTTMPYPAMPEPVTSFGAAVLNNSAYYYGGHTGNAHEYSDDGQGKTLFRLELKPGSEWESLEKGPGLQGLALVALNGKLYRMGGFTAKNKAGEDHDLWSQDDFAAYDPKTNRWEDLPALPEPRSSFDAAVLEGKIYIVGGWMLAGEGEESWHQTAWRFDPANIEAGWEQLPTPPFQKRALSVAAFDGKLYTIGGMTSEGQPTREVSIYSPQTQQWERGPALLGHGMTGFGTSAFAQAGALYVSAFDGTLQRLSAEETKWELIGQFENARFFHRMLPVGDQQLLILGGSNMSVGIFDEPELLDLSKQN